MNHWNTSSPTGAQADSASPHIDWTVAVLGSRRFHLCLQRRKDLCAGLFGRGEAGAAMLALGAIHYSELLAVGAGFARGPFLHAQKRQQPGHAEEQMEHRPTRLRRQGKAVAPPQPPADWEAHQRGDRPIQQQQLCGHSSGASRPADMEYGHCQQEGGGITAPSAALCQARLDALLGSPGKSALL